MDNQAYDPHTFIENIAAVSRSDGKTPGPKEGVGRQCYAFSREELRAHEVAERAIRGILRNHREGLDFVFERDALGSMFVTFLGSDRTLRPFMVHSHLDSVQEGGKYDGVAGIASALDILGRVANLPEPPTRSLRIGVYVSEESSPRNGFGCLGSAVATGTVSKDALEAIRYEGDKKLSEHLGPDTWARVLSELEDPCISPRNTAGSYELHIEQSTLIAECDVDIGIVAAGIGGSCRKKAEMRLFPNGASFGGLRCDVVSMEFTGVADHTGGTPPNPTFFLGGPLYRKDALVASGYVLNRLLRAMPAGLLRSISEKRTGFTTVPAQQLVELLVPRSFAPKFLELARKLADDAHRLFGVRVVVQVRPYLHEHFEVVERRMVRRYLNIPLVVSALSTKAFWRESSPFGTTRATVTDFMLGPRSLAFNLDLREVNADDLVRLRERIDRRLHRVMCEDEIRLVSEKRSQPVAEELVEELVGAAKELGVSYILMPSAPGHDSDRHAAAGISVGMVFVRQDDGISHSPHERMTPPHFDAAHKVMQAATLKRLR